MADERTGDPGGAGRQLTLLRELEELIRAEGRRRQAAEAEGRRLGATVEAAAARLAAMLAGERAARAALQALVEELHAAVAAEDVTDPEADGAPAGT